jgi:hypothetical protein
LHRYLAEFDFRYSNRVRLGVNDGERATLAVKNATGKRLTYRQPICDLWCQPDNRRCRDLGQAFSYGWRVTARCAAGKQDGISRHKECVYRAELDLASTRTSLELFGSIHF